MEPQKRSGEPHYVPVAGMKLVYQPEKRPKDAAKKHSCVDCHFCQFCSDARCNSCRSGKNEDKSCSRRKLSLREQIILYEKINAHENGR